ncbi:hypothetical protein AYI68_g5706 [Smittium mucronatum]|uniref:Uncharacterized protein n=1 Tax=Smittium mucronatum TaxID=133383 RepID=A0A1R0GTJ1_9FUNG|nr:hypothetical protein AYI68_g5706 [Smittium mucronatum]
MFPGATSVFISLLTQVPLQSDSLHISNKPISGPKNLAELNSPILWHSFDIGVMVLISTVCDGSEKNWNVRRSPSGLHMIDLIGIP